MTPAPLPGDGLLGDEQMLRTPDGRRLRTMVRGEGDALVVLEAGIGMSGLYWGPTHERIARAARVVAYERAGFGGSSTDNQPRDLARLVNDLHTVIEEHRRSRLVLVGHSWGGPIVRAAAAGLIRDGDTVDGLVLVDQSDEHADLYFSRAGRRQFSMQAALMPAMARLRLLTALTRPLVSALPQPLRNAVLAASCSMSAARATAAELRHVVAGLRTLTTDARHLDHTPMRVLSGMTAGPLDRRIRETLVAAHRCTAEQHPAAEFVPAHRSGHMIPITEPELIATHALALLDH